MLYEHGKVHALGFVWITTNTSSLHKNNNNERLQKKEFKPPTRNPTFSNPCRVINP